MDRDAIKQAYLMGARAGFATSIEGFNSECMVEGLYGHRASGDNSVTDSPKAWKDIETLADAYVAQKAAEQTPSSCVECGRAFEDGEITATGPNGYRAHVTCAREKRNGK